MGIRDLKSGGFDAESSAPICTFAPNHLDRRMPPFFDDPSRIRPVKLCLVLRDGQLFDLHDGLIPSRMKPDFMMGILASRRIRNAAALDVLLAAREDA